MYFITVLGTGKPEALPSSICWGASLYFTLTPPRGGVLEFGPGRLSQGPCVKGLVPSLICLGHAACFNRWDLVIGLWATEGTSPMGVLRSLSQHLTTLFYFLTMSPVLCSVDDVLTAMRLKAS